MITPPQSPSATDRACLGDCAITDNASFALNITQLMKEHLYQLVSENILQIILKIVFFCISRSFVRQLLDDLKTNPAVVRLHFYRC